MTRVEELELQNLQKTIIRVPTQIDTANVALYLNG